MFRRRPRRLGPRPGRPRPVHPHHHPMEQARQRFMDEFEHANQLMADGQPRQAAETYTRLARRLAELGRPRQAANQHARAAEAWLAAGVVDRATNQAQEVLGLFNRMGSRERAKEFKAEFAAQLKAFNLSESAEIFEKENTALPQRAAPRAVEMQRKQLPASCPQCGGPVRGDEIEWIDAYSAECDFCGATINALTE